MNSELSKTELQKKNFAITLDAVNLILQSKGFHIIKLRALIDALQGVAGGRNEPFICTHLNLARRLDLEHEKEISDEAKQRRVQRMLNVLEMEQKRVGKMLFTIIRGGGIERAPTKYIDHLTNLANLAMQNTQYRMKIENIESKKFKQILQEESEKVAPLLPDTPKINTYKILKSSDDSNSILREMSLSLNAFGRALTRVVENGGDVKGFVEHYISRVNNRVEAIEYPSPENKEIQPSTFKEVLSRVFPSENESEANETQNTDTLQTETTQVDEPNMKQEALDLAEKGFRVFPVFEPTAKGCSCKQGEICENAGKHPRVSQWQKVATTDKAQIKEWFQKWQRANIGIATGKGSNVIVLDVDANKGGDVSLSELFGDSDLPETLTAKTGNGFHFFFQIVENIDIKNSVVKIGEGLDIRGENGFVVASPSLHREGNRYSWMNETKPCPLPDFLKEKLLEIEKQRTTQTIDSKQVSKINKIIFSNTNTSIIPESTRNETLFRKASALRGKGSNEFEILERLREMNQTQCVPQLEESELQKIAQSAMRYLSNRDKQVTSASVSTLV